MSTGLENPEHPAHTQPGLHESELNPLDANNTNGLGTLGAFLGFAFNLDMMSEATGAFGNALAGGDLEVVGAMPEGSVTAALEADFASMQPTPNAAPQVATSNPTANNPFAIDPSRGMTPS